MIRLPLSWVQFLIDIGLLRRPHFLVKDVPEPPDEFSEGFVFREVRGGYQKWLHLKCPRCGEHIQIQLAGARRWTISIDWLNRPTVAPSIWQTGSCRAHFFIRKGVIVWCRDVGAPRQGVSRYV
ncbi:DUF6527 family protein [Bradyrhizobium sp. I1.7.5]|uniref:DUF6527 family protein n=1 Tax=Bradyrhizobium sp. I1.7.5 TaxID=3156363 RepID=UPI0033957CF7